MARGRQTGIDSVARLGLFGAAALLALTFSSGARAQSCMSDADCGDGFECDLGPSATVDCASDRGGGGGGCDAAVPEVRSGDCEPRKMTCEVDSDCITGLKCEHRDDSSCTLAAPPSAADAGLSTEPECEPSEPSPGECVYEFVDCEKDSDCDGGLICQPIGESSECSQSGSACAPGQECPPPEEEVCTKTTRSYCFPPRIDCDSNDDCKKPGQRCVALSDDAQEDPPKGWEGATALCLPEAFALVLEERVGTSGASSSSEDSRTNSKSNSGGAARDESSGAADDRADDRDVMKDRVATDAGTTAKGDGTSNDDGCAVSSLGAHRGGHTWLLLLAAAALLARRRRVAARS